MASVDYTFKYCPEHHNTKFVRPGTNHILHFFITIFTFGLWAIVWFMLSVKIGGWRCEQCGSKPIWPPG